MLSGRLTLPPADLDRYVEDLNIARTLPGERDVLTCQGWLDEKSGFFSILLGCAAGNLLIVGFQHGHAGLFDNQQLALIKGVGAI